MLEALGLSQSELAVYQHLLAAPGQNSSELRTALGFTAHQIRRTLADLEEKGLVSRGPGSSPRFSVPPPQLALEALVAKRDEELKRARLEVDVLLRDLPTVRARHAGLPPVDLVEGLDAARQRWVQIQRSAKKEVCIIDRPPHVISAKEPNSVELELLQAGIGYRLLYDDTSLDVPGKLDAARICISAGEDARVADNTPLKLVMADASAALTYDVQGHQIQDGFVVHASPLLDALVRLFNLLWETAMPLPLAVDHAEQSDEPELDSLDQSILALLVAGAQDEVIARRLGVAVRTIRRRVAHHMDLLGAKTRFQAGVSASKRGWV